MQFSEVHVSLGYSVYLYKRKQRRKQDELTEQTRKATERQILGKIQVISKFKIHKIKRFFHYLK